MSDFGIPAPSFRLPAGTHVGRVRLQVGDLDRSLAYYAGLLGFRVLDRAPGRAELGQDRTLIELHEHPGARRVPHRGRLGLFHFAILLPDRASLGRMLARLSATGMHVGMADHAVSESLYISDPDGLGIEIYADRPRAEWTQRGAELHMVTDPLDTDSLQRAAGKEPWAGMPKGTRVGHMHLHVHDLESAREFYHNALGLDLTVWSYPGALFMAAGGYHHHLGANIWAGPAAAAPASDEARLLHWELVLPSAAAAAEAIASLTTAGRAVAIGPAGDASVLDPSGTRVKLVVAGTRP
jgi:catechol 2,3-dioxygenase